MIEQYLASILIFWSFYMMYSSESQNPTHWSIFISFTTRAFLFQNQTPQFGEIQWWKIKR